jgi:hypothetical protein
MFFECFAKIGKTFSLRGIIFARHGKQAASMAKQKYGRNIWGIRPEYSTDKLMVYRFGNKEIPACALR